MSYALDALDFLSWLFDKLDNIGEYLDDFGTTYEQVDEGIRSISDALLDQGEIG